MKKRSGWRRKGGEKWREEVEKYNIKHKEGNSWDGNCQNVASIFPERGTNPSERDCGEAELKLRERGPGMSAPPLQSDNREELTVPGPPERNRRGDITRCDRNSTARAGITTKTRERGGVGHLQTHCTDYCQQGWGLGPSTQLCHLSCTGGDP